MKEVQFDGEQYRTPRYQAPKKKGFAEMLIAWGIVKNEQQAGYVLAGGAATVLILSLFIFLSGGTSTLNKNPSLVPEIAVPIGP
ncbi:hypothetical protein KJ819_00445 [Patescibacteria group bacterium]|nr:hypothetical protein [Patescibacteria group bacterium]MBU1501105.1 hypothetical protein [Patescibacteria group bacterium]MBU2081022.1 hypothetical protein [Patescibacteria group bacterium]MBU2124113.1 hypothetical protein [Patescibacteria group bacterium]MBU2194969.1 hypothetical protein [Patescibacteria group bacterium]